MSGYYPRRPKYCADCGSIWRPIACTECSTPFVWTCLCARSVRDAMQVRKGPRLCRRCSARAAERSERGKAA